MANSAEDNFKLLNRIPSRSLRELTYLLCSPDLQHSSIPIDLHYPIFDLRKNDQFGLGFYSSLEKKEIDHLEKVDSNTALGRYVERLLAAWFSINPNFDLLAANLQLIEDNITLGELDFLLREKLNKKTIHLEFALKYYLKTEHYGKVRFIGPKGKDSLESKAKKLVEQQLPLSQKNKNLLPTEFSELKFQSKLMLKGFIFHPYQSDEDWIWIKRSEINDLSADFSKAYLLEKRRDWIYPFDPIHRLNPYSPKSFLEEVRNKSNLPLLLVLEGDNTEKTKLLMIVEDGWPDQLP